MTWLYSYRSKNKVKTNEIHINDSKIKIIWFKNSQWKLVMLAGGVKYDVNA